MKRKLLLLTLSVIFSIFFTAYNAFAAVQSVSDINNKIIAIEKVQNMDFTTMYNKTDLIGQNRDNFKMAADNYKRFAQMTAGKLRTIQNEIGNASSGGTSTSVSNLYYDADNVIYEFNNKTNAFLAELELFMPSITYQKFVKKFNTYYNSLNILN